MRTSRNEAATIRRIAHHRSRLRLTQAQLAKAVGMSRPIVNAWEQGRAFPKVATLLKLSDLFGLSIDKLVADNRHNY